MRRARTHQASFPRETSPGADRRVEGASLLRWVLEETGVCPDVAALERASPPRVVSLSGGADALTYLVRLPGRDVVVKLNDEGLEAEATALRAWKPYTAWVPDVLGAGTVPPTEARPVKYLVLDAMVNDEGEIVETAAEYLERSPSSARDVGRELGAELHRMHQARCSTRFGNFADSPGAERTYDTWGSYLEEFFMQHADYVRGLGISDHQVEKARAFIGRCRYVDEARYLHGDVSIRNIAIRSYEPIRISLFDPNPLCGDPSWDVAPMTNNVELSARRAGPSEVHARDRDLLAGFWESYPRDIAEDSLLTARLVAAVLHAKHPQDAADDEETELTHELIRDLMDRMSA